MQRESSKKVLPRDCQSYQELFLAGYRCFIESEKKRFSPLLDLMHLWQVKADTQAQYKGLTFVLVPIVF